MPPYRFLFEKRRVSKASDALQLSGEFAATAGYEIIPTEDARALAAYLVSLRAETPLFEAPFTAPTAPEVSTNAPPSTNKVASLPYTIGELQKLPESAK
jgi:cytochrome c oxidase cbb3-type subunit 2